MRRIVTIVVLLLGLTLVGTVGLRIIEGDSWLNCLFMAVITLTTVGYKDVVDLTPAGKVFIIAYLVLGLGVFTYSAYQLGQWIVSAELRSLLERRRMERAISGLRDHYIICGLGRMGETIGCYLDQRGKEFVVIDVDEERLRDACAERNWVFLHGDATDDEVLKAAGLTRARSLASTLPTDADNVYVVISARMLSRDLQIISRASGEKAGQKMENAGANRVISPMSTGAMKMARFMINPSIEDFLEVADSRGNDLELADVQITAASPYVGMKLAETDLRQRGVMVIGIRRANGERLMPPPGSAVLEQGDSLFAFGASTAVNAMIEESEGR
ncbi:MAG: potassium channel family protein [Planctomycetaceae bacterium]